MLHKATFLVNFNLYESKRHFTKKLSEAMERKGIKTRIIDVDEQPFEANMASEIQRDRPDFTCSFNSFDPMPNGKFPWDIIKIPHLSILVDPALYATQLTNSPYSVISCVDRSDCRAVLSHRFDNVFFLPHGVEKDLEKGKEKRIYDVVFLGSCYDYEGLRAYWQKELPTRVSQVLDDAIQLVLSDSPLSLAESLVTAWNAAKLPPGDVDFSKLFFYLDNYTRGKDRVELIRSIRNAKIHIFGELVADHPACKKGWSHYLSNQTNVIIHPSVTFTEGLNILKQSKISLNSMPFFKQGSHERILTGLACGAWPITSFSTFWNIHFKDKEDLFIYQPGHWNKINEQVEQMLDNEKLRAEQADRGRLKVMNAHTWDNRVDQLLESLPPILKSIHE